MAGIAEEQAQCGESDRRERVARRQPDRDEPGTRRHKQRVRQPASLGGRRGGLGGFRGVGRRHGGEGADRQQPGRGDERQQAEEDVAPAEDLPDDTGDGRPEHAGQHPGRRERREHPRPQPVGQAPSDRHVRDRRDRAGAEALDEPGGDEDLHVRRQPADEQADREEPEPRREGPAEAALVDEPADDGDADQRAEEERGEDPAVQLHPAELARDDRHDGRDREGLEGDERDGEDEADGQGAPLGRPEAVVDGASGRLHAA